MRACPPRPAFVDVRVNTFQATSLLGLGRHAEALAVLDQLGEEGLTAHAQCLRARAYMELGKLPEAERAAAAARTSDPDHEWGYRLGAIVARKQLRPTRAEELADMAVQLAPNEPYTHQVRTLTAIDLGDVSRAVRHSAEMLRLAPHDGLSHYTRGLAHLANKQADDAEAAFRTALSIDPTDSAAMTALADVVADRDAALGKDLRLTALRTAPHEPHHRRALLKRGGLAGGGSLFVVGKLGILGKLLAFSAVRAAVEGIGGEDVVLPLMLVVYAAVFGVTRLRRWRHGRDLPPLVWEGLKAERHNDDLLWVAWPAGVVAAVTAVVVLVRGVSGAAPVPPWLYLCGSAALLFGCWQLRRGDARQLRVRDVLNTMVGEARFFWQRWRAGRRRPRHLSEG